MTGTVIDWHAHWVPPEVIGLLQARTAPPRLIDTADGPCFEVGDGRLLPLKPDQLDIAVRRRTLERAGIDRQVLSLAVVLGAFPAELPATIEDDLVEATNQGLARLVRAGDGRFGALALLPIHRPERAAGILERAVTRLGLKGAILPADGFTDDDTARRFADVLALADRLGAHLFIHPGPLPGAPPGPAGSDAGAMLRRRAVGFQDSLTHAAVTVAYSALFDSCPGARVHLANLGGSIALLSERIALTAERMGLPADWAAGGNQRFVVDTASFGAEGIRLAVRRLGAGRVVFGSDHPALAIEPGLDGVRMAEIDAAEREMILSGRALDLRG